MKTTIRTNNNEVIITLSGRLDTAAAAETAATISRELEKLGAIGSLTCYASELDYISSSGLRIMLSLTKQYPGFRVTDVQKQVYEVFETTGFTKIMNIERAMRKLVIAGCKVIGIGGVGKVYRLDDDTIIKVFREGTTMDEVRREITLSKEAFVLGMPTAISFDVVKVAPLVEGGEECYGLVYEFLNAKTLSAVVSQHPDQLDVYAKKYADLFRQLHQIEVPTGGSVPPAMERERRQVEHLSRYFSQENIDMLLHILDSVPEGHSLLHMDLQAKNVMVQDDELMLIDMGEMGYGHPLLDLGHSHSAMVGLIGDYEAIIEMPRELGGRLWNKAYEYYMKGQSADVIAKRKAQIEAVSCVRNFSWLSLSDSFPEAVIEECKALFNERVAARYDDIMEVCKTMKA